MTKSLKIGLFFICIVFISYLYLKQDFEKASPTLYKNGNIITLNQHQPLAEAMYVVDGRILEVGTNKQLEKNVSNGITV
ncbi:MAG: hypothetical protein GY931_19295, partial [Maribacter sp.]|nr:hypothetical protein [Maribacter sp.]